MLIAKTSFSDLECGPLLGPTSIGGNGMRFPTLLLLTLVSFSTTFSQPKAIVRDKGTFGLHVMADSIRQHKYLEEENQLLLVGWKSYQVLDLTNFRVIHTQNIDLTGQLLQTVFEPMVVIDLMGKIKRTRGNTVRSADWSKNGKTLYVFSADGSSISLWQLID